ncbi:MAG: VPS10 domain-containing protein [Acidobacteriaceae bacterium]
MMLPIRTRMRGFACCVILFLLAIPTLIAQTVPPDHFSSLRWRLIGPFRAGRVSAVAGVPSQPNVYYIGTPGGGIWKTDDAGQTWNPISDTVPVASIGAMAVSDSNPKLVFAGTGEQTQGNGVYKSNDGGATWANIGLQQTHVITGLIVDPRDTDLIVVSAQGDLASGEQRGIFRTTDGGKNWQKVLYKDEHTAMMDLEVAPDDPKIMYTTTWVRQAPGLSADSRGQKPPVQDADIYRSTDEGATWTQVAGKGLPTDPRGRIGVAVAPGSTGKTIFAIMTQGLYRSDDGGETWVKSTTDPRILGSWYFSRVFVDPKNPKVIYVAQTTMYRSVDGGKTFDGFYGAPSGDDIHLIWINPRDPRYMLLGVDQGAIVSVNGGNTWSSWYNQATGQFYHVTTDDRFPYTVYAAQQDSGTAAVASRSDYGEITYRDWEPTGGFEFSFIAPDPLNANYVYIGGWYGSVLRFDRITGQIVHMLVRSGRYRTAGMAPIQFSPHDPHALYAGANYVLKTTDGGITWNEVSPDLTHRPEPPRTMAEPGTPQHNPAGVITTIALSPVKDGVMWAGTNNGLLHVTRDGKMWQNVTPPGVPERSTVEEIEASHSDPATAYVTVIVQQDMHPHAFRTHDYGTTWRPITNGLPGNTIMRVVRDDSQRKGLLYGGTETGMWVSFDDGDHWQTLQLNLPTATVRDIAVHGDDVAIATYGRSLWILDDVSPLRQLDTNATGVRLFRPAKAVRTRWDMNQDTPLPKETPAGKNPPDGAILDYYLPEMPHGDLTLKVYNAQNNLVREYSSVAAPEDKTPPNVPEYWFAPQAVLPKAKGHNRFVWNLRYPAPKTLHYGYYGSELDYIEYTLADHAIPGETPREQPQGPLVVPGEYTLVLNVDGKEYRQPLTVTPDPRVHVSQADLQQQLDTEKNISAQMQVTYTGYEYLKALRGSIAERLQSLNDAKPESQELQALGKKVEELTDGKPNDLGLGPLNRDLARLAEMIESGDARPAAALESGVDQSCHQLAKRLAQWQAMQPALANANTTLGKNKLPALPVIQTVPAAPACLQ